MMISRAPTGSIIGGPRAATSPGSSLKNLAFLACTIRRRRLHARWARHMLSGQSW